MSDGAARFFTIVAGFGEIVLPFPFTSGATASFTFDPTNPTNFFHIYANTTGIGNNLSGAGFTNGTSILSGVITDVVSSQTIGLASFNPNGSLKSCGALDQSPPDNYPGVGTLCTTGAADLTVLVQNADANYFPDLEPTTHVVMSFVNSSLLTPFKQVDPSAAFSSDGITSANTPHNIGAINGISGPNFQFQADANGSLAVPEPATLALLGMGLAGLGAYSRRRKQQ